jgi:hypothetical protein
MLHPFTNDTYDIGLTGTRVRGVYAKFGEFFKSGSTSAADYVSTRKYNILDSGGASGAWDWQAAVTASSSLQYWRDNVGDPAFTMLRQESSSPVNYSLLYTDLRPAKRDTGSGHTVTDSAFPAL